MPYQLDPSGWVNGAKQHPSPNCNPRPEREDINLVVIHCISLPEGQYGTGCVKDLFLNRLDCTRDASFADLTGLRVSSHFFISRQGELYQFVSVYDRAWHAGVSQFQGQKNCNDFSIGIELEGTDQTAFEAAQYQTLNELIAALCKQFPAITRERIVGHSDIAPGRKTDPGNGFDWQRLTCVS